MEAQTKPTKRRHRKQRTAIGVFGACASELSALDDEGRAQAFRLIDAHFGRASGTYAAVDIEDLRRRAYDAEQDMLALRARVDTIEAMADEETQMDRTGQDADLAPIHEAAKVL